MKMASTKNEKPSSAKPSPKTLPKAAMKPGHSKPNSKLRMVPVTTPTAKSAIMVFDQRLASVRKSGSPDLRYRHSANRTIAGNADEHRPLHLERCPECRRDLIGSLDPEAPGPEGLGEAHDVDRAEVDAGRTAVLGHFLEADHVVRAVDPDQVDEVALEAHRGLELGRRKQEPAIAGDGHHLVAGADETRRDGPGQCHPQRLLPVGDQHLSGAKAVEMTR